MATRRPRESSPLNVDSSSGENVKRPVALNGISSTVEDRNSDFLCPICFDIIRKAHVTKCGHTFCYECITKSVNFFKRCPKCPVTLTLDMIFPNHLLDELVSKYRLKIQLNIGSNPNLSLENVESLRKFLSSETQSLSLPDVNVMLEILQQRKQLLESESNTAQNCLLYEFLKQLLKQKEEQHAQVVKEINLVKKDLKCVESTLWKVSGDPEVKSSTDTEKDVSETPQREPSCSYLSKGDGFNSGLEASMNSNSLANFVARKRRLHSHFEDFVSSYFSVRSKELYLGSDDCEMDVSDKVKGIGVNKGLEVFRENLTKFSRYSSFRPLATMHYSSDLHNSSTIVSAIVFDKDNEYFAIGGVTKRIKIYDYLAVIRDAVDIHYPVVEMVSGSKISCIAWNSAHKSMLASSDYEGAVNIWDVTTGQRTKCFHEHEKRCWSVDFNEVDTKLIVSGSDDARVKLWSLRNEHSIATLEAKANVCCVKFNPNSSCHLAFGSADHGVHYYDLRNISKAVCIFKGHKKAVSYVKFLNTHEIISASTDSQLKLWDTNHPPYCLRSFTGHVNEKNFVGLATDGDYIACGSEDKSLYIYYKGLSKPLMNYKVDVSNRVSDLERSNDLNEFVSAVCWRKQCNVVLAANSRGLIKILELI